MIRNLTPHDIKIVGLYERTLPAAAHPARCAVERECVGTIDGVPVNRTKFREVENLPEPVDEVFFVVSRQVAEACRGTRDDLLIVDETVRDETGRIIGCRALARI